MKRSKLIRPRLMKGVLKLESRIAEASRMSKAEHAKELAIENRQPVISVSIDAFKDSGFYTRSHESISSAIAHYRNHPQLAAAIFAV